MFYCRSLGLVVLYRNLTLGYDGASIEMENSYDSIKEFGATG